MAINEKGGNQGNFEKGSQPGNTQKPGMGEDVKKSQYGDDAPQKNVTPDRTDTSKDFKQGQGQGFQRDIKK